MPSPKPSSWAILILIGLVWGVSFPMMRVALEGLPPFTIVAMRLGLAAIIIWSAARMRGLRLPSWHDAQSRKIWLSSFGMAMLSNALPFTLLVVSLQYVSAGFAGITMAFVPLLVLPLGHWLLPDQPLTGRKILGFGIGFIGVLILIGPGILTPGAGGMAEGLARIGCVLAALCYALGSIVTRRAPPGSSLVFSATALLIAALMMVPAALIVDGLPQSFEPMAWASAAYLGVFPTALATLMLVFLIKREGPAFLSLANYQVPIWAVLLGTLFLDEVLPPSFLVALALVLAGLVISQARIGRVRA